ncbi:hypothetical protein V1527DRAFT_522526 [Lipomyces starkeyi]
MSYLGLRFRDWSDDEEDNYGNDDNDQFRDTEEPVRNVLCRLLPHISWLERVHIALSLTLTDQDEPGKVPLFSREWVAEEFRTNNVVFMPLGFSGFSATTRGWQMRQASVVSRLEVDEATTDALEVCEEFIQETLEDHEPAVLGITFNAMVYDDTSPRESKQFPCHSSFCLLCT